MHGFRQPGWRVATRVSVICDGVTLEERVHSRLRRVLAPRGPWSSVNSVQQHVLQALISVAVRRC